MSLEQMHVVTEFGQKITSYHSDVMLSLTKLVQTDIFIISQKKKYLDKFLFMAVHILRQLLKSEGRNSGAQKKTD